MTFIHFPARLRPSVSVSAMTLALAAGLSGCASIGPDFQAPEVAAPASWRERSSADPDAAALTPDARGLRPDWWRAFNDPVLDTLQQRAAAASPDLQTAALRLAQSRVQRTTVAAQRGPQVNASGAATRQRQSEYSAGTRLVDAVAPGNREELVSVLSDPFALYQAGFDASWELDLWGRVRRSIESAEAGVRQAEALLADVQLSVQSEIARQYVELRAAQAQLALTLRDITATQEQLDLTQARADGGLVSGLDPVVQRGQLTELRSRVPDLQSGVAQRMNQLGLLTGQQPGELNLLLAPPTEVGQRHMPSRRTQHVLPPEALPPVPRFQAVLPDLSLGLPADVARRRPDIRAAQARLHAATANIGVATADLFPRLTLGASFGLESTEGSKFGEWGTRNWQVGPSLSLPLFDQGRRRSVIVLRELEQQEAAVAFQQSVLKAWQEIDDALIRYGAEQRKHAALQTRLANAEDAWTLARAQYANGLVSYLSQLDAERNVLQARREWVQSDHQRFVALIGVYKAVGGGDELVPSAPASSN